MTEKVAVRGRNGNAADEPGVWGMDMRPVRIHLGDCRQRSERTCSGDCRQRPVRIHLGDCPSVPGEK